MPIKTIVFSVLGLLFLYGLFTVGAPFLLAMVIAMFLDTPIRFLIHRLRMNRMTASALVCSLFTGSVLGLFYLLGLKVVTELVAFWNRAPVYIERVDEFVHNVIARTQLYYEALPPEVAKQVDSSIRAGLNASTEALNGFAAAMSGYFINMAKVIPFLFVFFIVFIIALYLISLGLPKLKSSFLGLFEDKSRLKVDEVLGALRSAIFGFLQAQLLLSLVTGVIVLAGLLLLRVEFPLAIVLLIIVVDILPVLGVGTVLVPWAIYSFGVGNVFLGVGLLTLFLVITVVRRIIEPKVLGDSIGIGALAALVSLYVGFMLLGMVGLLLGPVTVIIYQAMRKAGLLQFKIKLE